MLLGDHVTRGWQNRTNKKFHFRGRAPAKVSGLGSGSVLIKLWLWYDSGHWFGLGFGSQH